MSILGNPITLGGGGAELNIDFGSTPPTDTSKLWVPLASKPDFVKCSPVLNYGSMYAEFIGQTGTNTSYTPGYQNCMIGDWIYFIGPCIYDTGTYAVSRSKYLRRYNVKTGVLENVTQVYNDSATNGGYRGMCGITVSGKLYFFGGVSYISSSAYSSVYSVYIFDVSSQEGEWKTYSSSVGPGVYSSKMSCCSIGNKIYITQGYDEANSRYQTSASLYEFDTESLVFSRIESMPGAYGCSCFSAANKVYVFGGYNNTTGILREFDITTGTKKDILTNFPSQQLSDNIVACLQINDNIFVFGNTNYSSYFTYVYKYSISDNTIIDSGYRLVAQAGCTAWGISGNDVYFLGGAAYNSNSNKVQKFTIQTSLTQNNLFLQADFGFDNPFTVVKGQKSEFEAYLRNAYIGDSNNIAQLTNAYIYDTTTNQWKTLSGESYILDTLNALNIMGVN